MRLDVIYNEDCLLGMQRIPSGSVDMILCDLPYGTTACKWDSVIPFEPLWEQYKRVAKPNAAIVLTASQPFTTALIHSNLKQFRYSWVWEKTIATNFMQVKSQPGKKHEDIAVFYLERATYNAQMTAGTPYKDVRRSGNPRRVGVHGDALTERTPILNVGTRYPSSVLKFSNGNNGAIHPTQKPVALFEYLIRTYTNPGQVVLDNCMGSGTTAIACINSGRSFIGFEKDPEYCAKAEHRILNHIAANSVVSTVADENAA